MPAPRPAPRARVDRLSRHAISASTAAALLAVASLTACGGGSTAPQSTTTSTGSATATATDASSGGPQGLAVPGVPDPCALLPADQVGQVAHIPDGAKSGAVASNSGGRSCAFNPGHPDAVTVSLTAVTKAGFDAFRATIPANTVTDLPGLGQEAYRTSQTPGVIDVFKNGFDLNISVIHADSDASASGDAKALATLLAAKL